MPLARPPAETVAEPPLLITARKPVPPNRMYVPPSSMVMALAVPPDETFMTSPPLSTVLEIDSPEVMLKVFGIAGSWIGSAGARLATTEASPRNAVPGQTAKLNSPRGPCHNYFRAEV